MHRRDLLGAGGALGAVALWPGASLGAAARGAYERTLILVELKGGNDGLNTVVPRAEPLYRALRRSLAIAPDRLLPLDERRALHPALAALMPAWRGGGLAIVEGVGYPSPNLSHFRSTDIWDTASGSERYLTEGWLGRAFATAPPPASFAADGVALGRARPGPLAGTRARTLALADPARFRHRARLAEPRASGSSNAALAHVLGVERSVVQAAERLDLGATIDGDFPAGAFGRALETAARLVAGPSRVAAIKVTLDGFDTHVRQAGTHERLLARLGAGLAALAQALDRAGKWRDTLVLTYSEFGRRPRENGNGGTDHGTAGVQLALGGRVRGGLYGEAPALGRLDGNGNVPHAVDYRRVYATVLERWWGVASARVLHAPFQSLDFV